MILVLFGLWCFAVFCFGLGWVMCSAAQMSKEADEIAERWEGQRGLHVVPLRLIPEKTRPVGGGDIPPPQDARIW